MLRWVGGSNLLDGVLNEGVRAVVKAAPIQLILGVPEVIYSHWNPLRLQMLQDLKDSP